MASGPVNEGTNRGSMWELDQNLDQPMDEEAGRLRSMYREKCLRLFSSPKGHILDFFKGAYKFQRSQRRKYRSKSTICADCVLFLQKFSAILVMRLAFQSLGVVFGDLGTSPLYVFYNTFPHGVEDAEDVIGALCLIIYSLTLIPLLKYVFVVLRANDNGQGKPSL
ncbi:hypothetical protein BHE74_00030215 [Ensete ventricosum]|nr:hypothetical protein BHE74_00030215 [Ensete ventricosum]